MRGVIGLGDDLDGVTFYTGWRLPDDTCNLDSSFGYRRHSGAQP
ncbi:hypothetical protein [Phytohalomonas tamaricis]|nr:hypothetical protein [Phytohalomonas tamaricis]